MQKIFMDEKFDITQFLISSGKIEKELAKILGDVIILDNDFNIVNTGIHVLNVLNYSADDIKGKPFVQLFSKAEELSALQSEMYKYGYFTETEVRLFTRLGHTVLLGVSGYFLGLITDLNGYIVINVKNLDDVKDLFEHLKNKSAELDEFLYRVSHDLRGPVATIKGLVNLAQLKNAKTDETLFYIDQIGKYADKLDSTLKNIIQTSDKDIFSQEYVARINIDSVQEIIQRVVSESKYRTQIVFEFNTLGFNPGSSFPQTMVLQYLKNIVMFILELEATTDTPLLQINISAKNDRTVVSVSQNGFKLNAFLMSMQEPAPLYISHALKDPALSRFYTARKIMEKINIKVETLVHSHISHTHQVIF